MPNSNHKKNTKKISSTVLTAITNIKKRRYLTLIAITILILLIVAAKNIGDDANNSRIFYISICGTFIGALSAFVLTIIKEISTKKNKEISSLNYALFIMSRKLTIITTLKRECEIHKDKLEILRALELPAKRLPDTSDLKFPYADLSFLLDGSTALAMNQLGIAQDCFNQTLETYRYRNVFLVETIQPIMKGEKFYKKKLTEEKIKEILGEINSEIICDSTADIYEFIEMTIKVLEKTQGDLIEAGKKIYPNAKFVKYSIKP
ncbi:hypothetical protein [Janthinobacterium sp. BJB426]|uniref:hypothetical protein n=1 Tax=Janthinobacterium sp. BJB426 TaxID=2048010 RepID=UPI00130545D3|nr:hypothetical protein [Janthinobacterium sp. BJB426]